MRDTILYVALAVIGTGLAVLLLSGDGASLGGLGQDRFASLVSLVAIALVIGAAVIGRNRIGAGGRPRLWHAAAWLAVLVALVAGYQAFQG
jgi:aspartyl protease family protein